MKGWVLLCKYAYMVWLALVSNTEMDMPYAETFKLPITKNNYFLPIYKKNLVEDSLYN